MICPLCETPNADDASECAECGKALLAELGVDEEPELVEGHEGTRVDADMDVALALASLDGQSIAPLDGLEHTQLADRAAQVEVEPLELDDTLPPSGTGQIFWSGEAPAMEADRVLDGGPRTEAPPEKGPCPWCGFPGDSSVDAICNSCGRRRSRFARSPLLAELSGGLQQQTILCPACFTRVLVGEKCAECFAPLPRLELI